MALSSLLRRLIGAVSRPLTLSQALSSAAGAGAMFIAAGRMEPGEFTLFALYTLIGSGLLGLARAGVFSAALVQQARDQNARVPVRYAAAAAGLAGLVFLIASWWLGVDRSWRLFLVAGSAPLPILYDWLRCRAVAADRRWGVALGDATRVLLTASCLLVPGLDDSAALQGYLSFGLVLPGMVIASRLRRLRTWTPYREYAHLARMQMVEFALGQTLVVVPLLILGNVAETHLIGGVRLAQSLLGPLNLIFAAAATNLIADGATRAGFATFENLRRRGSVLGRSLLAVSGLTVVAAIILVSLSRVQLRGVGNHDLLVGLVLVGASTLGSGWSSVQGIVLRLMGKQTSVTVARALVALPTAIGFVAGYLSSGTGGSLVGGFAALTVASPTIFILLARHHYRHPPDDSSAPALRPEQHEVGV